MSEIDLEDVLKKISKDEYSEAYLKKRRKIRIYKLINTFNILLISGVLVFAGIAASRHIRKLKLTTEEDDVYAFYAAYNVNSSYSETGQSSQFSRLSVIPDKPIKFNILMKNLTEEEKSNLQRSIDELNSIFKVINPAYQFELDLDPNFFDTLDPYNVDVEYMTEEEIKNDENALAFHKGNYIRRGKNGTQGYCSIIKFKPGCITASTFTHEILHHLGLGDAYKVENLFLPSIMQSGDDKQIRKNDIALLVARYGDYTDEQKKAELLEYIEKYEESQDWYKNMSQLASELKELYGTPDTIYQLPNKPIFAKRTNSTAFSNLIMLHKIENNICRISITEHEITLKNNQVNSTKNNADFNFYLEYFNGVASIDYDYFYFIQNDKLCQASKKDGEWAIIKYDICTEAEFLDYQAKQEEINNLSNIYYEQNFYNEIEKTIPEDAQSEFDFEKFCESDFRSLSTKLKLSYDKHTDSFSCQLNSKNSKLSYVRKNNYLIIGTSYVIFQDNLGLFKYTIPYYDQNSETVKFTFPSLLLNTESCPDHEQEID